MDMKHQGQRLLEVHAKLRERLVQIPAKREKIYLEEQKEENRIGKPRFSEPIYKWSGELLADLHAI